MPGAIPGLSPAFRRCDARPLIGPGACPSSTPVHGFTRCNPWTRMRPAHVDEIHVQGPAAGVVQTLWGVWSVAGFIRRVHSPGRAVLLSHSERARAVSGSAVSGASHTAFCLLGLGHQVSFPFRSGRWISCGRVAPGVDQLTEAFLVGTSSSSPCFSGTGSRLFVLGLGRLGHWEANRPLEGMALEGMASPGGIDGDGAEARGGVFSGPLMAAVGLRCPGGWGGLRVTVLAGVGAPLPVL